MNINKLLQEVLCFAFVTAVVVCQIWYFIHVLTTTPIMHKSLITHECLFIETPEGNRPCSDADKVGLYVESWQQR